VQPVAIEAWLRKKRTSEAWTSVDVSLLALAGGLIVLALTFWFTYAIIFIGWTGVSALFDLLFSRLVRLTHEQRLFVSGIFLLLLFVGNARTSREYLGDYPRRNYNPLAHRAGPFALLAYPGTSAKMITDRLYTGPRLVTAARSFVRRVFRLLALDAAGCAHVLAYLLEKRAAVSNEELAETFAGWNLGKLISQLANIEGVVFLELGVSLTDELRTELRPLAGLAPATDHPGVT